MIDCYDDNGATQIQSNFRVHHELAVATLLCLDCEAMTGARSARSVTRDRRCATCGSASVIAAPRHEWRWQEKVRARQSEKA